MTKVKMAVLAAAVLGLLAIGGASVLGVDEFLKLFGGVSDIVKEIEIE